MLWPAYSRVSSLISPGLVSVKPPRPPVIAYIVGVFDGACDGIQAQLIGRTKFGYTVKLLESKDAFRKGDRVHLSVAEFQISKGETHWR